MTALVVFLLAGSLVKRLARRSSGFASMGDCAQTFLAGVAGSGIFLFVAGCLHVPLARWTFVALPAAGLLALLSFRRGDVAAEASYPVAPSVLLAVALLGMTWQSAVIPLSDYDGRCFWLPKARAIYEERSIEGPFFRGEEGRNERSRYPLLVPLNAALLMNLAGDFDDRSVRSLYLLITVAFLVALRGRLSRRYGSAPAAWIVVAVAWLPQILVEIEGGGISAYSDLALAAFFGMAVLDVSELLQGESISPLFPLWLAALPLTKDEGSVLGGLVLVLAAIAVVSARRARDVRVLVCAALAMFGSLILLALWRRHVPMQFQPDYAALMHTLPSRLARMPRASVELFARFVDVRRWGLFWPVTFASAVVSISRARRKDAWVPLLALVVPVVVYVLIYTISTWDVAELASTSANRLLSHLIAPAALLLGEGWRSVSSRPTEPSA